jgi:hypothetical protein
MNGISYFQTAWLVNDIDEAMNRWLDAKGVGPFFVRRALRPTSLLYRGESSSLRFHVALAQAGGLQVELIQQVDEGPSAYRDVYPPGTGGFHHLGAYTDDLDADLERHAAAGVSVAALGTNAGVRFAYLDTRESVGFMTELIDRTGSEGQRKWFAEIAEANASWDGTDPVREVA